MKVLVTRPLENAAITIKNLRELGHDVVFEPLLQVQHLDTTLPNGSFNCLIVTSVNAIPELDRQWRGKRDVVSAFTTGNATRDAMVKAGFTNCHMNEGSALDLVAALPGFDEQALLLYPCAEKTAHNLAALLAENQIECVAWPCYRTSEVADFSKATRLALEEEAIDCVLLYSARAARCFSKLMLQYQLVMPSILTLSAEICAVLPKSARARCCYPEVPSESALMEILKKVALSPQKL